jgi:hypothetical protein
MTALEIILIGILVYLAVGVIFALYTTRGGNTISTSDSFLRVALWPLIVLGIIGNWIAELLYWIGGKIANKR